MTPHARAAAPSLAFGLLTVSDTRTAGDDASGSTMRDLVEAAGHRVFERAIVRDEPEMIRERILAWSADPACDAVVSSGGTGFSGRDRTFEAAVSLFERKIDGFGELFRMLSFQEIGSAAMLSRATAGVVRGTPVFLLPGAPGAVALGLTRLVLPEIGHIAGELRRRT